MSGKPVEKLKSAVAPLLGGGLALLIAALLYLFLTPPGYRATALVKLERLYRFHTSLAGEMSDQDLVSTEIQLAASATVMDAAVSKLKLGDTWGKKFNHGASLRVEQARALLAPKTDIYPLRESRVIAFRVTSDDKLEAAELANEIARAYVDARQNERTKMVDENYATLNRRWQEQSHKVITAEAKLYEMYVANAKSRETNLTKYYDPASYQRMQNHRVNLQTDYSSHRDDLLRLKAMSRDELAKFLVFQDTNNIVLAGAWHRLVQARDDLRDANRDHGANSPEVTRAGLVVGECGKTLDQTLAGALLVRENKVAALKSALDDFTAQLSHASTNIDISDRDYVAYANEKKEFENLKRDRDRLETELTKVSRDTIVPGDVSPELAEPAQPPLTPAIPNRLVAVIGIALGLAAALAGLVCFALSRPPKPAVVAANS